VCGRVGARLRHGTRTFGHGKQLLVIERIPYFSCPHCGERYYTAATLREVERLKGDRGALDRKRAIPVVSFGAT
jgi:YgiT-type zinc finger domain-containing protein